MMGASASAADAMPPFVAAAIRGAESARKSRRFIGDSSCRDGDGGLSVLVRPVEAVALCIRDGRWPFVAEALACVRQLFNMETPRPFPTGALQFSNLDKRSVRGD